MTQITDKPLKDRIKDEMKRRGVKVPQLEKETGIPKDRMYKWFQTDNIPKYEDAIILEKWIKGKEVPEVGTRNTDPDIPGQAMPILAKNSNNSEKLDTLLLFMQQQSRELKGLNHKLSELEQQNIVSAAIQTRFQEYLVSKLDADSDPETAVIEMQRNAFDKLTRIQTAGTKQKANNSHT